MNRAVLLTLALAACGDNHSTAPDAGANPGGDAYVPAPQAIVVAGDFDMTGIMSKLDITSLTFTQNVATGGAIAGDPVIRQIGNRVYVINRFGADNVTMFDARTLAFVEQFSIGTNSNPQDVAVVGNHLYVPAMSTTGMVRVSVLDGSLEEIDLGTDLEDPDGHPDCVSAHAVGNRVFVACQLLDASFAPRGPGKVAVYDTASGTVTDVVTLPYANPLNFIVRSPTDSVFLGDLLIPLVPSYTNYATGCVARISTSADPTAACAAGLTNADLGGFAQHLDVAADGSLLWMAVGTLDSSFANPTGAVKGFDLASGTLWSTAISPSSQLIVDLAACPDGSVVAVDRTMNAAGLRVFHEGAERTTEALPFGLPPAFGNNVVCYDAGRP